MAYRPVGSVAMLSAGDSIARMVAAVEAELHLRSMNMQLAVFPFKTVEVEIAKERLGCAIEKLRPEDVEMWDVYHNALQAHWA